MIRGVLVKREHVPEILRHARRARDAARLLGIDNEQVRTIYDEIVQRLEEAQAEEPQCRTSRS